MCYCFLPACYLSVSYSSSWFVVVSEFIIYLQTVGIIRVEHYWVFKILEGENDSVQSLFLLFLHGMSFYTVFKFLVYAEISLLMHLLLPSICFPDLRASACRA